MEKRISFTKYYAGHLYELMLENFEPKCYECNRIKTRLEKFIGKDEVAFEKRIVKKHPYRKL
jgi:hypothetical protein